MKLIRIISIFLYLCPLSLMAQNERKMIRQGYRDYMDGNYSEAEIKFRKAEDLNMNSFEARFNTGATLYEQEKYDETYKKYHSVIPEAKDPETLAGVWHNIGNSLLESQKYAESVDAYKNSLRLNPLDMDTKYNLAYAMKKLREQEQQSQNQEQQQNRDNQEQDQQEDQQDQGNDEQQQQQDQQEQQEKKEQEEQQENEQQQQQPSEQELSKEDAERILEAILQQEKDVKEKVEKKKAAAAKVKTEKDW